MKIFISWSGEQSHSLAKALHEWVPLVLHYAEPWLSQSDIDAGDRWAVKIAAELAATNFGIICITKTNISSPWILFESGALAKSLESGKVVPLLLDIDHKDVSGPLAQFQSKKIGKQGVKDVMSTINDASSSPVAEEKLNKLFESLWPALEQKMAEIPRKEHVVKKTRPDSEILEDLVSGVRGLEMRLRESQDESQFMGLAPFMESTSFPRSFPRRRSSGYDHYHPSMIMEMADRMSEGRQDPLRILIVSSFLRNDFPWIYDIGLEVYKAITTGRTKDARAFYQKFKEGIESIRHTSFLKDRGDKKTYILIQEMLSMLGLGFPEQLTLYESAEVEKETGT